VKKFLFIMMMLLTVLIPTFEPAYAEISPKLKYKIQVDEKQELGHTGLINNGDNLLVITKDVQEAKYTYTAYDTNSGEKINQVNLDHDFSTFSSSGNYMAVSTYRSSLYAPPPLLAQNQDITVYRLPDFKVVMQHKFLENSKRYSIYKFSEDEKYMYMIGTWSMYSEINGEYHLDKEYLLIDAYDLETGKVETITDSTFDKPVTENGYQEDQIYTVVITPDHQKVFLRHFGFMIYARDTKTSEILYKIDTSKGWNTPAADIGVYPEKGLLVIKGDPIEIDFFRYSTGEKIGETYSPKPIRKGYYPSYNYSVTSDFRTLISTSTYGNVETWNIKNGKTIIHRQEKGFNTISHRVINKHTLFYNISDRKTYSSEYYRILDIKENKVLLTVKAKNEFDYISEVNENVMVSQNEGTVYVWDIKPYVRQVIKVYIDGQLLDTESLMVNNRVMVPLRIISENLGFNVSWDPKYAEITLKNMENYVKLKIDLNEVFFNNKKVVIDTKPILKDGTTYVPIRFFANVSGAEVQWDQTNKKVLIFKK
jgi:hypothetical protein